METNQTGKTIWRLGCIGMLFYATFQILKLPFLVIKGACEALLWFLKPAANVLRWFLALLFAVAIVAGTSASLLGLY